MSHSSPPWQRVSSLSERSPAPDRAAPDTTPAPPPSLAEVETYFSRHFVMFPSASVRERLLSPERGALAFFCEPLAAKLPDRMSVKSFIYRALLLLVTRPGELAGYPPGLFTTLEDSLGDLVRDCLPPEHVEEALKALALAREAVPVVAGAPIATLALVPHTGTVAVAFAQSFCEPFGGLFTATLAAAKLGRLAFGGEIDPTYFQFGVERLRREVV